MNRLFFCFFASLLLSMNSAVAQEKGKLVFEKMQHNFGDIKEEAGPVEVTFQFKNDGKASITLEYVRASCGCTTPTWTRDPVLPGATGTIKAVYNPEGRPGAFNKTITVRSDGEPQALVLQISGRVMPRPKSAKDFYTAEIGSLRMPNSYLHFGDVKKGTTVTQSFALYNQGQKPLALYPDQVKLPDYLSMKLSSTVIAAQDSVQLTLTLNEAKVNDWGYFYNTILLPTDDADTPQKRIGYSARIVENFDRLPANGLRARVRFDRERHSFGDVTDGETVTTQFTITNTGDDTMYIRKTKASCGCTASKPGKMELAPGESTTLEVSFNSTGRLGRQQKSITVLCNDPGKQETILWIDANVVVKGGE